MARYRLRFLLQEIDLAAGETILGRSPACHVTIDDPLVSRRHAAVVVRGDKALVRDLGARNGLKVNNVVISGEQELADGDRIRIGTQELVFCIAIEQGRSGTRPTGFLTRCSACGAPYPGEAPECPQCGACERVDEETLSGVVGKGDQNWTLQLLVEVLSKAFELERWDDVERILRRARMNIEERLAAQQAIERDQLDAIARGASSLAAHRGNVSWAKWILDIYNAAGVIPPAEVGDRLSTLPPQERASLVPSAGKLIRAIEERGGPSTEDRPGFERVASLAQSGG